MICSTLLWGDKNSKAKKDKDEPFSVLCDRIEKLKGVNTIIFTGGEPTLYKELPRVIAYINKIFRDVTVEVQTNGRRFYYKDYTRRYELLRNFIVRVALHSNRQEIHDEITGVTGSFIQTITGIKNCLDYKIPTTIIVIINKLNYKDLPDIARFISDQFPSVKLVYFKNLELIRCAYLNRNKLLVEYSKITPYLEKAIDILNFSRIDIELQIFPLCLLEEKYRKYAENKVRREIDTSFSACMGCKLLKSCSGVDKTYAYNVGTFEIKKEVDGKDNVNISSHLEISDYILINGEKCNRCNRCVKICPVNALKPPFVNKDQCILCNACIDYCPEKAIRHISTDRGDFFTREKMVMEFHKLHSKK